MFQLGQSLIMFGQTDIDTVLSKGGGVIFKVAFLLGCVVIILGGIRLHNGDAGAALYSVVGGLVIACAAAIMRAVYQGAGMSGQTIDSFSLHQIYQTVDHLYVFTKNYTKVCLDLII